MAAPVKIYVGNIPSSARNSELKELFEKFGKVVECDILKDFGFVHMEDVNDAKAAIAGLNDTLWKGSRVRVEISTTKTSKGEPSQRYRAGAPGDPTAMLGGDYMNGGGGVARHPGTHGMYRHNPMRGVPRNGASPMHMQQRAALSDNGAAAAAAYMSAMAGQAGMGYPGMAGPQGVISPYRAAGGPMRGGAERGYGMPSPNGMAAAAAAAAARYGMPGGGGPPVGAPPGAERARVAYPGDMGGGGNGVGAYDERNGNGAYPPLPPPSNGRAHYSMPPMPPHERSASSSRPGGPSAAGGGGGELGGEFGGGGGMPSSAAYRNVSGSGMPMDQRANGGMSNGELYMREMRSGPPIHQMAPGSLQPPRYEFDHYGQPPMTAASLSSSRMNSGSVGHYAAANANFN